MHYVGCSGWQYKGWSDHFYPEEILKKEWFEYYSGIFNSVEINGTFYRLQKKKTFEKWREQAPNDFMYAIKGSRYVTHNKRLLDADEHVPKLMDNAVGLGDRLGVVLWQLPPSMKKDVERLEDFLKALPIDARHAIEFRHDSWWDDEVYDRLEEHNVAFVIIAAPGLPDDAIVTTDFTYIRFHGKKGWYYEDFTEKELERWADTIKDLDVKDSYVYFNNDQNVHAPYNAARLAQLLDSEKSLAETLLKEGPSAVAET